MSNGVEKEVRGIANRKSRPQRADVKFQDMDRASYSTCTYQSKHNIAVDILKLQSYSYRDEHLPNVKRKSAAPVRHSFEIRHMT